MMNLLAQTRRRGGFIMSELDRPFWEQRWASANHADRVGTATPNRTLTEAVARMPAGAALDAGCGEGADALWLAELGWRVDAVDFVATALDTGRDDAERLGPDIAGRIHWQQHDLNSWTPPKNTYDLVSAHYLHGVGQRTRLFRGLAAAVRPGGTLLIVGHHPSNLDLSGGTVPRDVFFTTADVVEVLDDGWELVTVDDAVPRAATDREGRPLTLRSAVVRARRR
jgi:SAM-dependent methyltransferase